MIFEPQAVGDLVQLLAFYADARQADEGRSPFAKPGGGNKVGETIVDSRVTLFSDPADPQLLGQPFDGEGFPIALLGEKEQRGSDGWRDDAEDAGWVLDDGRDDQVDRTWDFGDPLVVLARSRSKNDSLIRD